MTMKLTKFKKYIISLAALLIAVAATTACSSGDTIIDEPINEPIVKPEAPKTYTMTVQACKGDNATTRALSLNGSTLNATWTAGEVVTVYNETKAALLSGTLTAQTDGANTTLKGTLSGTIENGDKLKLKFLSPNYGTQDGTLTGSATSIDKVCDYAEASVDVTAVSGGNITTTAASFENQQAIVKFTLMKKFDNSNLEIPASTALTVNNGTNDYTVTPASATNVLFVAIPATSTVTLSTTIDGITYSYSKTGASLVAGKYYEIGVKMLRDVNLAKVNAATTLQNGDRAYGTLAGNYKISIANDATVTLDGVNINTSTNAGITCAGNANIILVGTNTVITTANGKPAIQAAHNPDSEFPYSKPVYTLTISGSGSLTATGGYGAAGIGSGAESSCGNITIEGGTVTAQGGYNGAGIGTGYSNYGCGNITISGGTVTATGGSSAAGIGTGYNNYGCGNITITEEITKVTATKGSIEYEKDSNCIGSGESGGTVGTIKFGSTQVYNGSAWTQNPMANGTYGGLNLVISKSNDEYEYYNIWTLTPETTN